MSRSADRHRETPAARPDDTRAFDALQEQYFLEGRWEDLVVLYRARLEAPSIVADPSRRPPLLFRLAQVLEARCDRLAEAEPLYWEVARLDPKFRPALRQLRHIYESRGQWDMLLQIAEIEGQIPMPPADRAAFLADLGEVWLDHLDQPGEAQTSFESALEGDPHQQKALAGLARTYQHFGRHAQAAAVYERLVAVLRGPERAPVLVALGQLYAGPLAQTDKATTCFRRAMTDDPRNEEAVEALVVIAAAREQWALLTDLYERRFDLAVGARHRAAVAVEAGTMELKRLHDHEAARSWFERARELVDDDPAIHHAFAELERIDGNSDSLRASLDKMIALGADSAPISVLLEAADLHVEAGDAATALRYLQRAHERRPDDPLVLEALSDALSGAGRSAELADVLERRAALAVDDPDTRADALLELSRIHEEDLGDTEAALDALSRAFDATPAREEVVQGLQRLYRKTERWPELRSVLERAFDSASGPDRVRLGTELGRLLRGPIDDLASARRAFESVLELEAGNVVALAGLEEIARRTGDEESLLRIGEIRATTCHDVDRLGVLVPELVPLLEARGEHERALHLVRRLLDVAPDDAPALAMAARLQEKLGLSAERLETLLRLDVGLEGRAHAANRRVIAALQQQSGDRDGAIASLELAIESDPADSASLHTLVAHYESSQRPQDVARVQRRLIDTLPKSERPAALARLATLLELQLGDIDGAIVVLWRLVDLPGRSEADVGRLEALLERAGRYEELAQHLAERRRGMPAEHPDGIELDLRRARILTDQLGQLEDAADLYRSIRSAAPDRHEAIEGLEQALRSSNDSGGLAQLLSERAAAERDPATRAQIELERAILVEESIADDDEALRVYSALAGSRVEPAVALLAQARIERLLERRGDWSALRNRLEAAVGSGSSDDDQLLHVRLAALCRDRLGDREAAVVHLEAIGEIDPRRSDVWSDLESLYEELDRPDDRLRVIQSELAQNPEPQRALVLHTRSARIHAARARAGTDPEASIDRARGHFERVLGIDASHSEASEFLIGVYESQDRSSDVARLLEARLADSADARPEAATLALELRLAGVRADRLGDRAGAIGVLEGALARTGADSSIAFPLSRLYEDEGRDAELSELCQRIGATREDAGERASWAKRRAAALVRLGEFREAVETYCAALVDAPGDREVEAALRDLYRELDEPAALAALLEGEIPRVAPSQRVALQLELSRLLIDRLGRAEEALGHLQQVLEVEPGHEQAAIAALDVSESLGLHDDVLRTIDRRLEQATGRSERAHWLERRGALLAGPLNRPEEAASAYREAVSLAADPSSARTALRGVMERLERWPAVLDCLHLEAQAAAPEDRAAILDCAVEIAREHVSLDATLPWLERLRAERPDDPSVLAQMADVHRQAGRPEALLRAIEQEIDVVVDTGRVRDLQVARARVLERDLRAPGRALLAFNAALEAAPDDPEILGELDRLCDLMGRVDERVAIIERRIDHADPPRRIELHRQAAVLHATSLADPDRAIPHLLRAVSICNATPGSDGLRRELLRELAEMLRAAGRLDAWARAAEAELAGLDATDESQRIRAAELHDELARACDQHLGLPDASTRHLRALLALTEPVADQPPVNLPAERIERAEKSLIARLRAEQSHVELAERLAARVARGAGGAEAWLELGHLRAERLHQPAAAARAYREVLARQPDQLAAIRGLRHAAELRGDWEEVARALDLELATRERRSPHEQSTLLQRLGDVCWHRLGMLDRAADAYRAGLEARPAAFDILQGLQKLEEQRGRPGVAMDLLEREIALLGDAEPTRRSDLWLRIARLAHARAKDVRRALHAYTEASAIAPLRADDQRAWSELYRADGDLDRYVETFAVWCDDASAPATARDQLALCTALRKLGRADEALARARRACEIDPGDALAWDVSAELLEAGGDRAEAAGALERAAALTRGGDAAKRLVAAAKLLGSDDLESIAGLLQRAVERDPGLAVAHAERARVSERLGEFAEAEASAGRGLDVSEGGAGLDPAERLECALCGGRAARKLAHIESAARFFAAVLAIDPRQREALEAGCELAFDRGDYAESARLAEARLEVGGENPDRARQLAFVGRGLEQAGSHGPALSRYREALERDAATQIAHEGVVRIHTATGQTDRLLAALEHWIGHEADAKRRAGLRVRAADLQSARGSAEAAEAQLRAALSDHPGRDDAWTRLVELLCAAGRDDETLEESSRALSHVAGDEARSRIALMRARILESRGETRPAAEAYGEAARRDARSVEAVLAEARLLRSLGDWRAAASAIERFLDAHPDPGSRELARVYVEWGRLASGPLEELDRAVRCYEQALALCPDLAEAREQLAALLAHAPDRWRDAVALHRAVLTGDPTRSASLRSLLELTRRRNLEDASAIGLAILRGLGSLSPAESMQAPRELGVELTHTESMSDPIWEIARRICRAAADEIAAVIGASAEGDARENADPMELSRAALRRRFGELTAPGLAGLEPETVGSIVFTLTALAADPGGNCNDGPYAHAIDERLGRWVRRKIRRTLGDVEARAIQAIDYAAWCDELQGMAACAALDAREVDLRSALVALIGETGSEEGLPPDSADLTARVAGSEKARALLRRVTRAWCDKIDPSAK